jgi:SecD/SecF fusion protein
MGFLATIALGCYALLSYATLVALGATLTLPGLAGFVLAIGMAIDANVLVFERAREEYAAQVASKERAERRGGLVTQPSLRTALPAGFKNAWTAIIDSNVTTLLSAGLLFFLASGPVRGFGVTLSIGVLASMVSALLIARVLTEWAVRRTFVAKRPEITSLARPAGSASGSTSAVRPHGQGPPLARDLGRRGRPRHRPASSCAGSTSGSSSRAAAAGVLHERQVSADQARDAVSDAGFPACRGAGVVRRGWPRQHHRTDGAAHQRAGVRHRAVTAHLGR